MQLGYRMATIGIGFLLDLCLGDPHWLWHPVQGIGNLIQVSEKVLYRVLSIDTKPEADKGKKQFAGGVLAVAVIALVLLVAGIVFYFLGRISLWLKFALECIICYQMLATKALKVESEKVYLALKQEGIEAARAAVSMIVGRDTEKLCEEGVTKAAVETVAENTSDGVVAPLFYMFLFGSLGGVCYKAINTMDSMIGYQNDKYRYFGTVAAKLDDIVNYVPSRIAAMGMIAAAGILGMDQAGAYRIWKRDRRKHASPNSAQTEAACAGALGICLAGDAWYFGKRKEKPLIGDCQRQIEPEDIKRAGRLLYGTAWITLLAGFVLFCFLWFVTGIR